MVSVLKVFVSFKYYGFKVEVYIEGYLKFCVCRKIDRRLYIYMKYIAGWVFIKGFCKRFCFDI